MAHFRRTRHERTQIRPVLTGKRSSSHCLDSLQADLEPSKPAGVGSTSASKMTVVAPSDPILSSYRLPGDSDALRTQRPCVAITRDAR
jgi:hypothetical protein